MDDKGELKGGSREPRDVEGSGARVFLSYRREDVPDATDRLATALAERLGESQVFLDVDSIEIGAEFAKVVGDWIERCDVVLAVIGRNWVGATDDEGRRRLDNPGDYVRLEIEAGLERDVRVVPVLIHGARIPKRNEVPESLVPLLDRNAVELSRTYWDFDVDKLVAAINRIALQNSMRRTTAKRTIVPARVVEEVQESSSPQGDPGTSATHETDVTSALGAAPPEKVVRDERQETPESTPLISRGRDAGAEEPWVRLAGVRAGATVALCGAIAVIASLIAPTPFERLRNPFYRVPVATMTVALIVLLAATFYYRRRRALVVASGLAMVVVGVTLPLGWPQPSLPTNAGFWVGVCGAVAAAAGAAVASWLAYSPTRVGGDRSPPPESARLRPIVFGIGGTVIVLTTLFVFPERANAVHDSWAKWGNLRYPVLIIVLCAVTIALAVLGAVTHRRRWLVIAAIVACLTLGEALPLVYRGVHDWGSARWLRLAGALLAVVALAAATTSPRRAGPAVVRRR